MQPHSSQGPGRGQAGQTSTAAVDETGDLGPAGADTADLQCSAVEGKPQGPEATFLPTGRTSGRASPRRTKPAFVLVSSLWEIEYLGLEIEEDMDRMPRGEVDRLPRCAGTAGSDSDQIKTVGRGPVARLC